MWFLYILECADGSLYTGIAKNLKKRLMEHNDSVLGAKYTRGRRPVKLVYSRNCGSRSETLRNEFLVKKFSRKKKRELIKTRI